jgi:hypothetical protein
LLTATSADDLLLASRALEIAAPQQPSPSGDFSPFAAMLNPMQSSVVV